MTECPPPHVSWITVPTIQERAARWSSVGIASLRDEQLNALPEALWSTGTSIRVADLGGNKLTDVPASLAVLNGLQRLRLSHNQLTQEGIPWTALASLPHLTVLALDYNRWASTLLHVDLYCVQVSGLFAQLVGHLELHCLL